MTAWPRLVVLLIACGLISCAREYRETQSMVIEFCHFEVEQVLQNANATFGNLSTHS